MADWPVTFPCSAAPRVEFLDVRAGGVYIDATFGAGGYTRADPRRPPIAHVIGIDRDQQAVAARLRPRAGGGRPAGRWSRIVSPISRALRARCGYDAVDGVVLDLGVSSMQLDEAARGFSFRLDGPLDMRMGGDGPSAADVVARASERDLATIIATLGEERHARAVARAIVRARDAAPIETTGALADIVGRVVHARPGAIHPATRTFQALRIFVNEELAELAAALACRRAHVAAGRPAGRGVVPFARGSHRQDRSSPRAAAAAPAPAMRRRRCSRRRASASSPAGRSPPTTPRSPPIRARAPPSCAPPSAPTRRPAATSRTICCRGCRRSPRS